MDRNNLKRTAAAFAVGLCALAWAQIPAHAAIEIVEKPVGLVGIPIVEKASVVKLKVTRMPDADPLGLMLQLTGTAPVVQRQLIERTTVRSAPGTGIYNTVVSGINIVNPFSWMMNSAMTGNNIVDQTRQGMAGQITKYRRLVAGKEMPSASASEEFSIPLVHSEVVIELPGGLAVPVYTDRSGRLIVPVADIRRQLRLATNAAFDESGQLSVHLWVLAHPEAGKVLVRLTQNSIAKVGD